MILNMLIKVRIVRIYILYLTLHSASFQFIENRLCHGICFCSSSDRLVICDSQNLGGIPNNVNPKYTSLTIQKSSFMYPTIQRQNLTGLGHLKILKVIYSDIISIKPRAFEDLVNLNNLDLSHNKLQVIEPHTFSGLNLKELHVMDNPGLKLLPDSFADMKVKSINLRSNKIDSIPYDIFSGTNFEVLFFFNNNVKTLDEKFSDQLSMKPNSFIDLTGNPLNCSCELKWLLPILEKKREILNLNAIPYMKSINFTCEYPLKLKGKEFIHLSVMNLSCPKPKITAITVALGIPETELTCVAIGNNHRIPGVAWNYAESNNVRELRRPPLEKTSNSTENLQTSLSVKVKVTDKLQAFTCTSWFEDSQSENIIVKIQAPPQYLNKNTLTTINYSNKTESNTKVIFRPLPEGNVIFRKQFTILEMIGAVVGTFVITLILLIMLAQIFRWWKRGHKSETNYKSVNIIKPYWTLGHDSNNTYSQPISHTDYDFPRTFETEAPSMCQSPPLRRGEFLDYKTQNRIFST